VIEISDADFPQSTHKLGLAVSIEGAPEDLEEVAQHSAQVSPPY
jgi:hypothetical protein